MKEDKKNTYGISFIVEQDMSTYENIRSFSPSNSTNVDPADVVDSVMRDYKSAWDELAK